MAEIVAGEGGPSGVLAESETDPPLLPISRCLSVSPRAIRGDVVPPDPEAWLLSFRSQRLLQPKPSELKDRSVSGLPKHPPQVL